MALAATSSYVAVVKTVGGGQVMATKGGSSPGPMSSTLRWSLPLICPADRSALLALGGLLGR